MAKRNAISTDFPIPISGGVTGQSSQQSALDAITNVSGATNEYILTKDTGLGNAIFKAAPSATSLPVNANDTWLKWRNVANSADLNLLKANVNDDTALNAVSGKSIVFQINETTIWKIDNNGHLQPNSTNSYDIGSTATRARDAFVRTVNLSNDFFLQSRNAANSANIDLLKLDSGNNTILNAPTGEEIFFQINNGTQLRLNSSGNLIFTGSLDISSDTTDGNDTGLLRLTAGGGFGEDRGANIVLRGNEDGTYPGRIYIQSGAATPGDIAFQLGSTVRWYITNVGVIEPSLDNDVDIGSSSKRVRKIYTADQEATVFTCGVLTLTTNARLPNNQFLQWRNAANSAYQNLLKLNSSDHTVLNAISTKDILLQINEATFWKVNTTGHFVPETDSATDIGTTSIRVRKIYADAIDSSDVIDNEVPSGDINGINTVYTTANNFINSSLKIYLNGVRLREGALEDYTITDTDEFTLNSAPLTSDTLICDYRIVS